MNKNNESGKIPESIMLANSIKVTFYDLSKKIAADRWLIKVKCEVALPVQDEQFDAIADAELASAMKQDCANTVIHNLFRERNFIDEKDKDGVLQELFNQLDENVRTYMGRELFPRKLFEKKVEEFRLKYQMQKEMERSATTDDEDDGPADFSACFRD
ncbi:MAG: hypothetical protein KKC76_19905 [Proteobacteria bacterium]|nr:hypothetical protein [Pseudomonadota bacterium]MBU4297674.1 hypothetical protein [Pseudomonadota bacterium]MCG2748387.1 hypothetical protein [Desulfobulbaceae bacterium]